MCIVSWNSVRLQENGIINCRCLKLDREAVKLPFIFIVLIVATFSSNIPGTFAYTLILYLTVSTDTMKHFRSKLLCQNQNCVCGRKTNFCNKCSSQTHCYIIRSANNTQTPEGFLGDWHMNNHRFRGNVSYKLNLYKIVSQGTAKWRYVVLALYCITSGVSLISSPYNGLLFPVTF
jgi:hypothetical protein